jgi:putative DNA primase/helicase
VTVDRYAQALEQLRGAGLVLDHIELGRSTRVQAEGDKGGKKSGWYVVHELLLKNGERAFVGRFQNWKVHPDPQVLRFDTKSLSKDDKEQWKKRAAEVKAAADLERAEKVKLAGERARRMWPRMRESGRSTYLEARRVKAYGIRFAWRGSIAVPVRNDAGDLVGLQFINEDASKKFLTGTPTQGSFHSFGDFESAEPIAIGEGYATMASVHEASSWPCVAAFNAGNLLPVARAFRARFPSRKIIVIGDDDHETAIGNKGKTLATAAAAAIQAHLALPAFTDPKQRTDFNDMHQEQGLSAVRARLLEGLGLPPPAPPGPDDHEWDFSTGGLMSNFTLIYGTVTVFDHRRRKIIGIAELRAAGTRKRVNLWLNNPARRIVEQENVVFDPAGTSDPTKTVNLFRGMAMKPAEGACERQLELLNYICGGGDENQAYDWVLKWLAYPLQHPGAKMQTALILHGPEGVGKNLLFSAIRQIYGEYGGVISQSELENRFNGWASAKLFLIGNEVVNRAELYHVKGKLKNMITETEWVIEEKNMPHRFEANHCNFAFFSNAIQPAGLDPDDRRYMIVYTPHPQKAEFYRDVRKEQLNDGVAALYHYLMHLDLGDFTEHTKPLVTQAKSDLIELGMDTHERFFRQWKAGELPIIYGPCLTMALYQGYRHWCRERGERSVAREAVFSGAMHKRVPKVKKKYFTADLEAEKERHFFVPEGLREPGQMSQAKWLGQCVTQFDQQLTDWAKSSSGDRGDKRHE